MSRTVDIDFLSKSKIDYLVEHTSNPKYKCVILLMSDAGLRVSECLDLKLGSFDFKERLITVNNLKKRDSAKYKTRLIPITNRLYSALFNYIPNLDRNSSADWLFPGQNPDSRLTRQQVNKYLTRFKAKHSGFNNLHPHALRHSYATYLLSNGETLDTIQRLLGHERAEVTSIYAHIPTDLLKERHSQVFDGKKTRIQKIKERIVGKPSQPIINIEPLAMELMIGRDSIMHDINDRLSRNINLILLGPTGVGKSTMLKNINSTGRKILYLDDCSEMKTTLLNTLLYLLDGKEKVFELIFGEYDKQKLKTKLSRHTMKNLAQHVCDVVQPHEYILVIDTVDRIPPRVVDVLETFKDHFTIITAARELALNKTTFLWNFEPIKVEPLTRSFTVDLISHLSGSLEVEDYEQFKNYIWHKSDGNPRIIQEMVQRFRKEPVLTREAIKSIDHFGSIKEIDMSLVVLIALGCMAIFRYYGRETGDSSLTFIGGCAMILLILSRYFFNFTKRKVLK